MTDTSSPRATETTTRRHLALGWWSVLVFLALGIGLEAMHGLKLAVYLDLANSTRRHMWTLAHAHGTLLGLMNVAFALSVKLFCTRQPGWVPTASRCLLAATILLPGGFFLGGVVVYAGDPGLGILLVPIGALALLVGVWLTARGLAGSHDPDGDPVPDDGGDSGA